MTADVLAQRDELAGRREQAGRVEPARRLEHRLGRAQPVRERQQGRGLDHRAGRDRLAADLHLVERRLAADPARRGGDEVALGDRLASNGRARSTVISSSGGAVRGRVARR